MDGVVLGGRLGWGLRGRTKVGAGQPRLLLFLLLGTLLKGHALYLSLQ